MLEFLTHIKTIVDKLPSVGNLVPLEEHVDVILEGIPLEYESVISIIESKFDSPPIAKVVVLLLGHESRAL